MSKDKCVEFYKYMEEKINKFEKPRIAELNKPKLNRTEIFEK